MTFPPLIIAIIITTPVVVTGLDLSDVITPLCAVMSMNEIGKCGDTFIQQLEHPPYLVPKAWSRGYCCALNHLRDCIVEHVGETCGDTETINRIVTPIVSAVKQLSVPSGDCHHFRGFRGTVLCQPDLLLILETIGVVILFLMSVSAVIRCCDYGSSGGDRPHPTQAYVIPSSSHRPVPSGDHKYL